MKIHAICTDIDGTLLDSRRQLSDRTIAVIRKVSKDIPVILASSRMPSAMRHLQRELGIADHPLICYNGGYVIHFPDEVSSPQVFDNVSIPSAICESILALAKQTSIHISLYHADEWYAPLADHWTDREQRITKVNAIIADGFAVINTWQNKNIGAHKVMCMGPEQEISILEQQLNLKHGSQIHIYRSRATYLELAPRIISKGTALELVLKKQYGLKLSEVMAFGDNYNDIDMLKAVGLGVAVGNAREEVKAVAKEITLNSIEDGVAVAIEKYC